MTLISEEARKFISANVGSFAIVCALVYGGGGAWFGFVYAQQIALNNDKVTFERDRAKAQIEDAKLRLKAEKLLSDAKFQQDLIKRQMDDVNEKEKLADTRMREASLAIQDSIAQRGKISPQAEFLALSNEFTQLGIDLHECYTDKAKYDRAQVIATRLYSVALRTRDKESINWAESLPSENLMGVPPCRKEGMHPSSSSE